MRIITNNPLVMGKYQEISCFQNTDVYGIFTAVRDKVHKGAVLLTHPLSGSVKPNETPYKSVILSIKEGDLDLKSLNLIENAIDMLRRLQKINQDFSSEVLNDFMVIDLELINSALIGGK